MKLRSIIIILALMAILSSGISGGLIYVSMKNRAYEEAQQGAANHTASIQFRVNLLLSETVKSVRTMTGLPALARALAFPSDVSLERANQVLDTFKNTLNAEVCYLMDATGKTLASSNRDVPQSFVGKNYAFRPYFQEAMRGHAAVFMAIGVTSNKRGIYFSYPVMTKNTTRPLGIAVIKASGDALQKELSNSFHHHEGILLLTDPQGVIFLSDQPAYEDRLLWSLSDATIQRIKKSRQFGAGPWPWSGMRRLESGHAKDSAGNTFLIHTADIDLYPGWQIIHLSDMSAMAEVVSGSIFNTFIPLAISVCILISIAALFLFKQAQQDLKFRNHMQSKLTRQADYLETLHTVSLGMIRRLDIDDLLVSILQSARHLINTKHAFIYLLEADKKQMRMHKGIGGKFDQMHNHLIQPGQGLSGEVWASGQAKGIDGYRQYPDRISHPALDDFDRIVAVPVMTKNTVQGVLGIGMIEEKGESIEDTIELLTRFSELIAISLDNAQLYGQVKNALEERQKAEMRLERSETRFRSVIEKNADAIMVVDDDGIIRFANPAAEAFFNRSQGGLVGSPFGFPVTTGEGTEIEVPNADGTSSIAEMRLVETEWEGDTVYFASLRDVSERVAAEKEHELLEKKLQQSQKMEAIGTLAGGIAHDFNNILSAVIGFSELSLDIVEKETQLELNLKEMLKAGYRAKELVRQILTFSRQSDQESQPIQVSHLAKEVLKLLRASLPTTIEIRQYMESDSLVVADPTQIHQVLMNLCTNAGFAMRGSGGILTVSVQDVDPNEKLPLEAHMLSTGKYQKISVSDTGKGVEPSQIDRIFDPFFTTKEKGEGTGMGLSVVHGIVKDHGGMITVDNKFGQGVSFHVYLPIIQGEIQNQPVKDAITPHGTEHILFVDDELALTKMGKQVLERLGYTVADVSDSQQALSMFKSDPHGFDLLITDLTMPSLTGIQLAKEVLHIRPDFPIILSTGFSGKISDEEIKSIGIKAVLMKPPLKNDLANTVREVLDG